MQIQTRKRIALLIFFLFSTAVLQTGLSFVFHLCQRQFPDRMSQPASPIDILIIVGAVIILGTVLIYLSVIVWLLFCKMFFAKSDLPIVGNIRFDRWLIDKIYPD